MSNTRRSGSLTLRSSQPFKDGARMMKSLFASGRSRDVTSPELVSPTATGAPVYTPSNQSHRPLARPSRSATVPSRPPRPVSPALTAALSHSAAPTPAHAYAPHRAPAPPLLTDAAWFIPVPVLDRRVYPFEYQFGGTIGEGGFGKVMLALHAESRQEHAIKVVALRRLRSRREVGSIANEIRVLQRVARTDYPFLARPGRRHEWYWQYRGNVHLVMEYYRGGDLERYTQRNGELKNPRLFKLMTAEVILGILALHNLGIIHHDIKPSNILIDEHGHCVLTDYGGSCFITPEGKTDWLDDQTPIFTLRYAAPEVLLNGPAGRSYGPAADFWSLGVTLFELATGEGFIDEPDDNQAVYNLQHGLIDMSQLALLTPYPGLRPFVEALLVSDSTQRLQGPAIKTHNFLATLRREDWRAIERRECPPFRGDKQIGVNPRNTSYDYVDRPGESLLVDANEDIVNRWFMEEGVGMPHHKQSTFHTVHQKNARVGLPHQSARRLENIEHEMGLGTRRI